MLSLHFFSLFRHLVGGKCLLLPIHDLLTHLCLWRFCICLFVTSFWSGTLVDVESSKTVVLLGHFHVELALLLSRAHFRVVFFGLKTVLCIFELTHCLLECTLIFPKVVLECLKLILGLICSFFSLLFWYCEGCEFLLGRHLDSFSFALLACCSHSLVNSDGGSTGILSCREHLDRPILIALRLGRDVVDFLLLLLCDLRVLDSSLNLGFNGLRFLGVFKFLKLSFFLRKFDLFLGITFSESQLLLHLRCEVRLNFEFGGESLVRLEFCSLQRLITTVHETLQTTFFGVDKSLSRILCNLGLTLLSIFGLNGTRCLPNLGRNFALLIYDLLDCCFGISLFSLGFLQLLLLGRLDTRIGLISDCRFQTRNFDIDVGDIVVSGIFLGVQRWDLKVKFGNHSLLRTDQSSNSGNIVVVGLDSGLQLIEFLCV